MAHGSGTRSRGHLVMAFLLVQDTTWQQTGSVCLCVVTPSSYIRSWGSTLMTLSNSNHFPKDPPVKDPLIVRLSFHSLKNSMEYKFQHMNSWMIDSNYSRKHVGFPDSKFLDFRHVLCCLTLGHRLWLWGLRGSHTPDLLTCC